MLRQAQHEGENVRSETNRTPAYPVFMSLRKVSTTVRSSAVWEDIMSAASST